MSQLVDIARISQETGYSEPEIMDLVDRKLVPYLKFADLGLKFPLEEILARGIKKTPATPAEPAAPPDPEAPPVPGPNPKKKANK